MVQILTDKNFLVYACQNYHNPCCRSTEEFADDLRRIKYIKKLITRYMETGELKERLILNHTIILNNVFRPEPLCRILFLKMEPIFGYIKPFLVGLNILVPFILNVQVNRSIDTDMIAMDPGIVTAVRTIFNVK
jgi:hypothetical protein